MPGEARLFPRILLLAGPLRDGLVDIGPDHGGEMDRRFALRLLRRQRRQCQQPPLREDGTHRRAGCPRGAGAALGQDTQAVQALVPGRAEEAGGQGPGEAAHAPARTRAVRGRRGQCRGQGRRALAEREPSRAEVVGDDHKARDLAHPGDAHDHPVPAGGGGGPDAHLHRVRRGPRRRGLQPVRGRNGVPHRVRGGHAPLRVFPQLVRPVERPPLLQRAERRGCRRLCQQVLRPDVLGRPRWQRVQQRHCLAGGRAVARVHCHQLDGQQHSRYAELALQLRHDASSDTGVATLFVGRGLPKQCLWLLRERHLAARGRDRRGG
mmetsp:Transcript_102426/g.267332  ORF Transcript_102426/g.267332 Transcript_102426/m.267332 type:complete len:322 (+) Transcript_102426:282-1247(+)